MPGLADAAIKLLVDAAALTEALVRQVQLCAKAFFARRLPALLPRGERPRFLAAQPNEIGDAVSVGLTLSAASLSTSAAFAALKGRPSGDRACAFLWRRSRKHNHEGEVLIGPTATDIARRKRAQITKKPSRRRRGRETKLATARVALLRKIYV